MFIWLELPEKCGVLYTKQPQELYVRQFQPGYARSNHRRYKKIRSNDQARDGICFIDLIPIPSSSNSIISACFHEYFNIFFRCFLRKVTS
jgi:hypothetical protein